MIDFTDVKVLTFDCYGTLIDWEEGIAGAFRPLLERYGVQATDDEVLERYGSIEAEEEQREFRPYREVLSAAASRLAESFGAGGTTAADLLLESFAKWPPFADTREALVRLQRRFRLVIVSNVDRDLFALTQRVLGIEFDHVVTAEDVRAYKPATAHFERVLADLQLSTRDLVHVAQSLFHDHVPAQSLGIRSVWINRRAGRPGSGATPPSIARFDLECPTLAALADALGAD